MAYRTKLIVLLLLLTPSLAWAQATAAFTVTSQTDETDASSYTFSNVDIGSADATRNVAVFVSGRRFATSSCSLTSATIGGAAATVSGTYRSSNTASGSCSLVQLIWAPAVIASGTTTTITLTFPNTFGRVAISVLRFTNLLSITPAGAVTSSAAAPAGTLTTYGRGVAAGVAMTGTASTTTWAGLSESFDTEMFTGATTHSGALLTGATSTVSTAISATFTSSTDPAGVFAAWGTLGPVSSTVTHYARPDGSAVSACTLASPCNLTRAFAIAGTAAMPPGSYLRLMSTNASGVLTPFSEDLITTTGGGTQAYPIRMVGDGVDVTRITGLQHTLGGSVWTRTTDATGCGGLCDYVWQTPFDDAALFQVAVFGQRPPVTAWNPIIVDSRNPPFTTGSGRAYTLDEPVRYTVQDTIGEVELQHCTFFHNTSTNILYMHPCMETTPVDADHYAAGPRYSGSILYRDEGDYLTLESLTIEHTTDSAIEVQSTGLRNQFLHLKANGATFYMRGNQTVGEDWLLKQATNQGPVHANCYGPDYGGGGLASRSCWSYNTSGSSEYLLIIGQLDVTGLNQTFDHIQMERAWNGYVMNGAQTLNHASCYGLDNHCGQAYGTGWSLTNGIFQASQDSLYLEYRSFNNISVTNNLFLNGVLFWCSGDGFSQAGTTCPSSWTFSRNIVGSFITDTITQPSLTSDCNAWIPRSEGATIWRMTPVNGSGSDPQYETLAEIQAGTNDDDNSITWPYPSMTNGSIFANFTSQQTYPPDFTLAPGGEAKLTACGAVVGPDTLAESDTPSPTGPRRFRWKSTAP